MSLSKNSRSFLGRSPFPATLPNGKVVVDEMCHCGHLRSEHRTILAFGHGDCTMCKDCPKYTWKAMIFHGEPLPAKKGGAK